MPYTLDDPRQRKAEAPYTFFLPHDMRLREIGVGDSVQLIFCATADTARYGAERMWVTVTGFSGDALVGDLNNVPIDIPGLTQGDAVEFKRWHVIDVNFEDPEKDARLVFPQREYYDRCIVDDCVLTGEARVHYLYREEPDMGEAGDKDPDSGWRIRGDWRGQTDEDLAARDARYVALGAVLNRDDSWLHLIDEPIGTAYLRDWEQDQFVPAKRTLS